MKKARWTFLKKQLEVYKKDKWNQMNILVHGKRIVVSELSSTFGETTHEFYSKGEMMAWARSYFSEEEPEEFKRMMGVFEKA